MPRPMDRAGQPTTETGPSTPLRAGLVGGLARNAKLAWRLLNDPRVSPATKLVIPGIAVLYLLWPADFVPDIFPLLGQIDDLALLALGVKLFLGLCPPAVVEQHRDALFGGRSKARSGEGEVVEGEYRWVE